MANHKIGWPKKIGQDVFLVGECLICGKRFSMGQMVDYVKIRGRDRYIHAACFEKELNRHD